MYPVAFHVGPVAIATHDVFVLLGVAVGAGVFALEVRRRGAGDERLIAVVAGALLCGVLAGQLGKVVWAKVAVAPDAPLAVLMVTAGRSILSGLRAPTGAHCSPSASSATARRPASSSRLRSPRGWRSAASAAS